jgi:transposase-like protein
MTKHAMERFAQRGLALSDVELILEIGSEVKDGYLVSAKDRQAAERLLKDLLNRIRRVEGRRIVVADGSIVTGYRADRREACRLLRRGAERALR